MFNLPYILKNRKRYGKLYANRFSFLKRKFLKAIFNHFCLKMHIFREEEVLMKGRAVFVSETLPYK